MIAAGRLTVLALALPAFLVPFGLAVPAAARGLLAPAEQTRLLAQTDKRDMVFFLAKGSADSCGEGCGEWIAAEGKFVPGTAQRLRDLLAKLGRKDLPIFFHSPGGSVGEAVQVGNVLQERAMTAGIGRAFPEQCRVFARQDPCLRMIASGAEIKAQLRTGEGQCHSACVIAFAGASSRRVAAGALIGIHAVRQDAKLRQRALQRSPGLAEVSLATVHDGLQQYMAMMGVDPALQQHAAKVDTGRIYVLSRDEIVRFGLAPGETFETSWLPFIDRNRRPFVVKSITRATEGGRREHRRIVAQFRCIDGKVWFLYRREMPPDETGHATLVRAAAGDADLMLIRGPTKEVSELWAIQLHPHFLHNVLTEASIKVTERVRPKEGSRLGLREINVVTGELSKHIDAVVHGCASAKLAEVGRGEGKRSRP